MRATQACVLALLTLAIDPTGAAHQAYGRLINYANDPDLAEAMSYDTEYNQGRREGNRDKAEHFYLRFLARSQDPAMRARVYTQLGALYATNINRERGETKDLPKAREYMRKAIAELPDAVMPELKRARSLMVGSDQTPEQRLRQRIDNYKWLMSTDEQAMRERWVSNYPLGDKQFDHLRPLEIQSFEESLARGLRATETNLLGDAKYSKDTLAALHLIIKRLPGTRAAERAQDVINKWQAANVDQAIDELDVNVLTQELDLAASESPPAPETALAESIPQTPSARAPVRTNPQKATGDGSSAWGIALAIALVGVVSGGIAVVFRRRPTSQS